MDDEEAGRVLLVLSDEGFVAGCLAGWVWLTQGFAVFGDLE